MTCEQVNSYGWPCGQTAAFAVYLAPEDATACCGKHLAAMVRARLAGSEAAFVKVCQVS